jgi:hypothetical protein
MRVNWTRFLAWLCAVLLGLSFWALVLVLLSGCASNSTARADSTEQQDRVLVRETTEVRQEVHDGQLVELRTKIRVVEQEQTDREASRDERVEVEEPKILSALKPLASAAATAVMGPAGGAAVDWIWQTVAGVGAMGTAGGVGVVMRERTRRRQLIQAQDAYTRDIEEAETDAEVDAVKAKHAARQKALGIHDQLTRERHGV